MGAGVGVVCLWVRLFWLGVGAGFGSVRLFCVGTVGVFAEKIVILQDAKGVRASTGLRDRGVSGGCFL